MDGKTYSGPAIGFHLSRNHYSGGYRGVVTILRGAQTIEIEYLDIDKVERIASD